MRIKIAAAFLLLATALAVNAMAEEQPHVLTVAVYGFAGEGQAESFGPKVAALVTANLATEKDLALVERSEISKAFGEEALDMSGLVSSGAAAKVGHVTGANVLVAGQVIVTRQNHLVLIANIIGTDNARLFAAQVEGPADDLMGLTAALSSKIAQTILREHANLVATARETNAERLDRMVKSITGARRPIVSVAFHHPGGPQHPSYTGNTEMGIILQKAGFALVDGDSDRKPDFEITGVVIVDGTPARGGLHTEHAVVDVKVRDRRTGLFIAIDHQVSVAVDATQVGAQRAAEALAIDQAAEHFLPLLAR